MTDHTYFILMVDRLLRMLFRGPTRQWQLKMIKINHKKSSGLEASISDRHLGGPRITWETGPTYFSELEKEGKSCRDVGGRLV